MLATGEEAPWPPASLHAEQASATQNYKIIYIYIHWKRFFLTMLLPQKKWRSFFLDRTSGIGGLNSKSRQRVPVMHSKMRNFGSAFDGP